MDTTPETKRILIVDDSVIARMALKKALLGYPCRISEVSSGQAAIDLAAAEPFDCIILDYNMPGLNGLDVLEHWRKNAVSTPVIVVTANQQEMIIKKFEALGATAVIKKNPDKTSLTDALKKAFA